MTRDTRAARAGWGARENLPLLLTGIFFTFTPVGIAASMIPEQYGSWRGIATTALITGLNSVVWSLPFVLRRHRLLFAVGPFQLLQILLLFPALDRAGWYDGSPGMSPSAVRSILVLAAMACIIVGFICGVRSLRRVESRAAHSRAELDIASAIHRSLVPDLNLAAGRLRVHGVSSPSNAMGGDLIDASPGPGRTDILLADVSGHGVGAGIVMGMVKSSARTLLRSATSIDRLVSDLNVVLTDLTRPEMFATLAALRVFPDGRFEFCLAGHLPILHRRADGSVLEHPNGSLPLGIEASETYTAGSALLAPGDTLLLITDGLIEVQNADGRELGLAAVRDAFAAAGGRPLPEVRRALFDLAERHGRAHDDRSLILVRTDA